MTPRKDFPVFDCDSHVVEPPAIWDEYVPAKGRAWVKTQFCFHTDSDLLYINGRVVPAARERSNAAEVGWARWDKKEVGRLTPGAAGPTESGYFGVITPTGPPPKHTVGPVAGERICRPFPPPGTRT